MDGSVSASTQSTERAREHLSQLLRSRSATNTNNAQGSLFEQLLSIPVTPKAQPQQQCCEAPSSIHESPESSVAKQSDEQAEKQVDDSEKDSTQTDATVTAIAQAQDNPVLTEVDPSVVDNAEQVSTEVGCECTKDEELTPPEAEEEQVETIDELAATTVVVPQTVNEVVTDTKVEIAEEQATEQVEQPEQTIKESRQRARSAVDTSQQNNLNITAPVAVATDSETALPLEQEQSAAQENAAAKPDAVQVELKTEESSNRRTNRRDRWFERDHESKNSRAVDASSVQGNNPAQADEVNPVESTLQDIANTLGISVDDVTKQVDQAASVSAANITATAAAATQVAATQSAASSSAFSVTAGNIDGGAVSSTNSTTSTNATQSGQSGSSSPNSNTGADKTQANEPTDSKSLTQQERVRLIQRVSRSFNRMTAEGGQINLRLHPQNLGSLNMQVQIEGRSLSAKLLTETTAARDAILQDLPALRQRLADQGYDVAKFQVEVANNGADAAFGQQSGQSQSGESSGQSGYKPGSYEIDYRRMASRNSGSHSIASTLATAYSSMQTNAGIDVHA